MSRIKRGAFRPLFVSKKREVFKSFCMILLAFAVYGNLLRIMPVTVAALPIQTTNQNTAATNTQSSSTLPTAVLAASIRSSSNTEACTVAAPYSSPEGLTFDSSSPALTTVIDDTGYYQVYGSSLQQLRAQVQACKYRAAVAGDYHAVTARQINWSYSISQTDNVCTLQNLHVGLHIAQLLPTFVADSTTPASVAAIWNTYAANLAAHENGHVALATRYAEGLAAKLQAIGPMPCSLFKTQVEVTISTELTMLNTEDALYDSKTGHGATQGAVL